MRITLDVNDTVNSEIELLQEQTGGSKKAVILGALRFLGWALEMRSKGLVIAALDPDQRGPVREYHSDVLQAAAATSRTGAFAVR